MQALRTLRSRRAKETLWALRTNRSGQTLRPLGTSNAEKTLRTLRTCCAVQTLRALRPQRTKEALWALRSNHTLQPLGTLRADHALQTLRTLRSYRSVRTLWSQGVALKTLRALGSLTLFGEIALGTHCSSAGGCAIHPDPLPGKSVCFRFVYQSVQHVVFVKHLARYGDGTRRHTAKQLTRAGLTTSG